LSALAPHLSRSARRLFVALSLALLGACQAPIESSVTLGEPDAAALDPRLVGAWVGGNEELRVTLLVNPRPESPVLDVLIAYGDPTSRAFAAEDDWVRFGWFRATVEATTVDGAGYYAATRVGGTGFDYTPAGHEPGPILFRAEFDADGSLTLAGLSETAIADHGITIEKVAIAGEDTYRRVGASRGDLLALLRAIGPDRLFAERWGPLLRAPDAARPFTVEGPPEP
jgi:hypothetical protein